MPEKKQDARVRYTKMMIRNSLLELLRTKPIAKITVTEICEMAGINRATFYAHYSDPSDLLHALESEIIEDVAQHPSPARSRCLQQHRPVVQQQAHTRLQQFDEALRQGQASRPQLQRLALGQAERPLQRPCPQLRALRVNEQLRPQAPAPARIEQRLKPGLRLR